MKLTVHWLVPVTMFTVIHGDKINLPDCPGKQLTVIAMENPPYVIYNESNAALEPKGVMIDFFASTLKSCYKECRITWKVVNDTSSLFVHMANNQGDFALPITSSIAVNFSWPIYKGPSYIFRNVITTKYRAVIVDKYHLNARLRSAMLSQLIGSWPIFVFAMILAGLSGICIWILESRTNSDEFNKSFVRGSYEGFWWAFISMTTVGYGDKAPKTIIGRAFGVVWILIGVVLVTMFTATATNALTNTQNGIEHFKVAVLSFTDAPLAASILGAQVLEFNSLGKMYEALKAFEVDGIFIDQYVGSHYMAKRGDGNLRILLSFPSNILYSMAFLSNKSKSMLKDRCFEESTEYPSFQHFLQKYATPSKAFDFNSDFIGLFSSERAYTIMMWLAIILGAALVVGIVFDKVFDKRKISCYGCRDKCCTVEKQLPEKERQSNKQLTNVPLEVLHTKVRPISSESNNETSVEMLIEEVQKLRETMDRLTEKLRF